MTRVGCPECGRVFTTDDFDYCACEADVVALSLLPRRTR